jgi:hypothetical protein
MDPHMALHAVRWSVVATLTHPMHSMHSRIAFVPLSCSYFSTRTTSHLDKLPLHTRPEDIAHLLSRLIYSQAVEGEQWLACL